MKKIIPFVAIFTFIAGCKQPEVDLEAEAASIKKADSAWAASVGSDDIDKIISYWSDDAVVLAPGQPEVKGKQALRKMVEDSKKIPGFNLQWRSSDPHFSPDGKLAYMYAENVMTLGDSTGRKIDIPGREYTIWRKESDGNWKCVVDIWNNPPQQ